MEDKFIVFANRGCAVTGTYEECAAWAAKQLLNNMKITELPIARVIGHFKKAPVPVLFESLQTQEEPKATQQTHVPLHGYMNGYGEDNF